MIVLLFGERKNVGFMSPMPETPEFCSGGPSGWDTGTGWYTIGVIQRTMRFQSFDTLTGITGWINVTFWERSAGPMPKFQVGWTGTLMRLATGFCAAFLNCSPFSAAAGVSS